MPYLLLLLFEGSSGIAGIWIAQQDVSSTWVTRAVVIAGTPAFVVPVSASSIWVAEQVESNTTPAFVPQVTTTTTWVRQTES